MPDFGSPYAQQRIKTGGLAAGATGLTTLTLPASTNTKSAWTELVASTEFDAEGFWLHGYNGATNSTVGFIDLAIGPAGSETTLLENVWTARWSGGQNAIQAMFVPLRIPAGTRISARVQLSSLAGVAITLGVVLCAASFAPMRLSRSETLNANTTGTTTFAATVDAGGTANTKGAWVELSASLPFDVRALLMTFASSTGTLPQYCQYRFDVGIGSSGAEVAIVSDLPLSTASANTPAWHSAHYLLPIDIPAGSRLTMRAQCSSTVAADRAIGPILHLFG